MKKFVLILLSFPISWLYAQTAVVDTIVVPVPIASVVPISETMNYPIIRTGNNEIDKRLNHNLKVDFLEPEDSSISIDSALTEWSSFGIVYSDFKITYNQGGIISILMSAEGCAAYCTVWSEPFVYSLESGNKISITEIIDTAGAFHERVIDDLDSQYHKNELEIQEWLSDPEESSYTASYDWALDSYKYCRTSFNMKRYILYANRIEIYAPCYLPNAIKNLTPIIELSYPFEEVNEYLRLKN